MRKISFEPISQTNRNTYQLGTLTLDFGGLYTDGKKIDLESLSYRPKLARDFSIAFWEYVSSTKNVQSNETVAKYFTAINKFWRFLDQTQYDFNDTTICSKNITNEIMEEYQKWICSLDLSHTTAEKYYAAIRRLLSNLKEVYPEKLPSNFQPVEKKIITRKKEASDKVKIYTPSEMEALERTCRREINSILSRLLKGPKGAEKGSDPRIREDIVDQTTGRFQSNAGGKWAQLNNVLWFIQKVLETKYYTKSQMAKKGFSTFNNVTAGIKKEFPYRREELFGFFLPSTKDLLPFIILLAIKTGLNRDSILLLERDCKRSSKTIDTGCVISYVKKRGSDIFYDKTYDDTSRFSPGQIISEILRITAPLVEQANPEHKKYLFLGLSLKSTKTPIKFMEPSPYLSDMINGKRQNQLGWCYRNMGKLISETEDEFQLDFRKLRETYLTNKYKKEGNLAKVSQSARHKSIGTTANHYIDGEATKHLHEETIQETQDDLIELFLGHVLDDSKDIHFLSEELNESEAKVSEILSGQQDVFIASCKDFYNKPNGIAGKACDEPWGCFMCENAVWTSRILPRVIAFYQFIEEQKLILGQSDWTNKFWIPYSIIKYKILPNFTEETIGWAKRKSRETKLFIPNSMRSA